MLVVLTVVDYHVTDIVDGVIIVLIVQICGMDVRSTVDIIQHIEMNGYQVIQLLEVLVKDAHMDIIKFNLEVINEEEL
jgi:hypothetical protein